MDTSLISRDKNIKRLNFKTGELSDNRIFYIDIETLPSEEDITSFIETFKRRLAQATMIPTEFFDEPTIEEI
jgi:hypothetical protein